MIQPITLIQPIQHAGYESLLLILLVGLWVAYRYYKTGKTNTMPDEYEIDSTQVPDYDIPEAKAVFRDPFVYEEVNIYNSRGSDPISASISDIESENTEDQHDNSSALADFDPKKAVIWSEIIKRPYC